jgi:hypothetical protein
MSRNRPIGITLLSILAVLSSVMALIYTFELLDILPFSVGRLNFFTPEIFWIGALLWALIGVICIWVARMLWTMDPRGWTFLVLLSALNLIMAIVSLLGHSSWRAMLPTIFINGFILIYCFLPSTREAFVVKQ